MRWQETVFAGDVVDTEAPPQRDPPTMPVIYLVHPEMPWEIRALHSGRIDHQGPVHHRSAHIRQMHRNTLLIIEDTCQRIFRINSQATAAHCRDIEDRTTDSLTELQALPQLCLRRTCRRKATTLSRQLLSVFTPALRHPVLPKDPVNTCQQVLQPLSGSMLILEIRQ